MSPRIGLIIASTRNPRICPQIADFVLQTIFTYPKKTEPPPAIQKIDLAAWKLAMFDEPIVPATVKDSSGYKHEHTRAWSREIASYDAFIFVSPQYNCSMPASLKNAIDYLFNEWVEKPAMIVTYGGNGADKSAEHLQVSRPEICIGGSICRADVGLDAESDDGVWASERAKIVDVFGELQALLKDKEKATESNI